MGHALEAHSHPLERFFVPGPPVHEEDWLASAQGEDLLQEAHGFQVRPSRGDPESENLPRVDIDCGPGEELAAANPQLRLVDRDYAPALPLGGRKPSAQPAVSLPDGLVRGWFEKRDHQACPPEGQAEVVGVDRQSLGGGALPPAFENMPTFKYFEQCFENSPFFLVCIHNPDGLGTTKRELVFLF